MYNSMQLFGPSEIYKRELLNKKNIAPQIVNETLLHDEYAMALKVITAPVKEDLTTTNRIRQGCQSDRRNIKYEGPRRTLKTIGP